MGLFHSPSPVMAEGKTHLSLVVCGHVDAGKSTTTGHLLFELGGISEREMEKLKEKAAQLGKSSFSFAFYLDTQKDERERGVTISCTTKEQGAIIKESKVKFTPSDGKMPCRGKVFSIEMHHKQVERAMAGDNVGLNIKGLSKENMPRVGDIICDEKDSLTETAEFTMQVAVQDHPGQLKAATYDEKSKEYRGGFCPIAFARTARAPVQLKQIDWKMGKKSTGGA